MPFADVREYVQYAAETRASDCLSKEGSYQHAKVKDWVQSVTDGVVADCKAISTDFKWMGTCFMVLLFLASLYLKPRIPTVPSHLLDFAKCCC